MARFFMRTHNFRLAKTFLIGSSYDTSTHIRVAALRPCARLLCVQADTKAKVSSVHNFEEISQSRLPNFLETCPGIKIKEVEILNEVLEQLVEDLGNVSFVKNAVLANQRMMKFARYALVGKTSAGVMFLEADRFYAEQRRANNKLLMNEEEHFRLASVVFWTFNMYNQSSNTQDDVVDGSETRGNVECWHMVDGIGLGAIRDSRLLNDAIFVLLRKYFKNKEYYTELFDLMITCIYGSSIGFSEMEIIKPSINPQKPKSVELLRAGKQYAFGCVAYGCIVSAMMMNGFKYQEMSTTLFEISLNTALIAAISDDYIDCYCDARVNERKPTDIKEGKQTWLYWKALELANPSQAQQLSSSYGVKDDACENTVKSIYRDLSIQEIVLETCKTLEKIEETKILKLQQDTNVPWCIFLNLMKYYSGAREGLYARPC